MKKNKKVMAIVLVLILIVTVAVIIENNRYIPIGPVFSEYGWSNEIEEKEWRQKMIEKSIYPENQIDQDDKKLRSSNELTLKERINQNGIDLGIEEDSFYETAETFTDIVDKRVVLPTTDGEITMIRVSNKEMVLLDSYNISFICPKQVS